MSSNNSNKIMVPNAREAMNKFKMEAANGSVGGQMVKKMIESYENGMK